MKPSEVLKNFGWCRGSFARTIDGLDCSSESEKAVSFCIYGALNRAVLTGEEQLYCNRVDKKIRKKVGGLAYWNDNICKDKDEVVAILEAAEKEVEDEGNITGTE